MADLSNLSDHDLILYYNLMKVLGKRGIDHKIFNMDCKFAYHIVRLMDEVEQILELGDLDLERSREHLKAIRRGEVKEEEIYEFFASKEKDLEKLYHSSKLPHTPDEPKIKALLMKCLEIHFGSLADCVKDEGVLVQTLRELRDKLNSVSLE